MRHTSVYAASLILALLTAASSFISAAQETVIEKTADSVRDEWRRYLNHLQSIKLGGQQLGQVLSNLHNYRGAGLRMRRVVHELLTSGGRRQIKVVTVGGSITWGHGTSRGSNDWVSVWGKWLTDAFPTANISVTNAAIPATPSAYMALCLELCVPDDTDLVIAEYALNDGFHDSLQDNPKVRDMERLVRRVLALPSAPALVLLQMYAPGLNRGQASPWRTFTSSIEDAHGQLSQYYDLPWLSYRTATYSTALEAMPQGLPDYSDPAEAGRGGGEASLSKDEVEARWGRGPLSYAALTMEDMLHPSAAGHKVMSDLAVWLVQQVALGLVLQPWGRAEHEVAVARLPPPMLPGNEAPRASRCVHSDALQPYVTRVHGFEWLDEGFPGKPKRGYVATQAGSVLELVLDTRTSNTSSTGDVVVSLAHLRSYGGMGKARVECAEGCSCSPLDVNAHHKEYNSQTYLASIQVKQVARCLLRVTVVQDTDSGKHKFKVSGVMVADTALQGSGWFKAGTHQWGSERYIEELKGGITTHTRDKPMSSLSPY